MGIRRDDIPGHQRTPIVLEALSPHRPHGTISRLAREHGVSRQTIYQMAAAGRARLTKALTPGRHGPHPAESTVRVDRNRLVRGSVVLTGALGRDCRGQTDGEDSGHRQRRRADGGRHRSHSRAHRL